ncbi:ABC transporter permease [Pseudoflavonifractor sp. MSJ-37]|uniref:ABC transporter permease n=1 Tax=Pseudoflavonifractor sp. MSJ-37 TaxID=2841531 RepID=UPI0020A08914|nr:ABC transporter permease subunit [Pseudoflavonifractor sp. MSJ-37]
MMKNAAPVPSGQDGMTRQQLLELESAPKTRRQILLGRLILVLPLVTGGAALAEYWYLPNYKSFTATLCWPVFLGVLLALYGIGLIVSLSRREARDKLRSHAPFYAFLFVLLMVYDILTLKTNTLLSPYFAYPNLILNAFLSDAGYLAVSTKSSMILLMTGYLWGVGLGLVTGIACGYSRHVDYWIAPFLKLLGAIPSVTWIPISMILMKSLFHASVFVIALGVWFSVTIACITGIQGIDKADFEAARTLGASERQLIFHIAIPSAVPNIFQGMTQGMSTACMALITAEMIGSDAGLGWYITWQRSWAQYAKMYAAIILLCVIFIGINFLMDTIRRHVLRWKETEVDA